MTSNEINSNSPSLYVPGIEEIKDSYAFDHCFALGCERCSEVEEGYTCGSVISVAEVLGVSNASEARQFMKLLDVT